MEPRTAFSLSVPSTQSFQLTKLLVKSATSSVYEGKLQSTGQRFAVKKVDKAGLSGVQLAARRLSEVEIPSRYDSESLLSPFGHFEDDKSLYVVLELCEGGDLRRHLETKKILSEEEVCSIAREVAQGLLALHDGLTVHRNLSLSSVLLTADGHAVLPM